MAPNIFTPEFRLFLMISAACFGACVGSFLNVCIYRIPLDESVILPRSHCRSCGRLIPWYHNIPVLSYFILRGKCAYCGAGFSFRYAFVELITSLFFVSALCMWAPICAGHPPMMLIPFDNIFVVPILWLFISGVIIAAFVDLDHFVIPDRVTIGGVAAGLLLSLAVPELHGETTVLGGLVAGAVGALAGFIPLQTLRLSATYAYRRAGRLGKDEYAMGFGDVKYIAAVGAFLGWHGALFCIAGAALLGTLVALPLLITRRRRLLDRIPFGPYISLAALIWIFWGGRIVSFYTTGILSIGA